MITLLSLADYFTEYRKRILLLTLLTFAALC